MKTCGNSPRSIWPCVAALLASSSLVVDQSMAASLSGNNVSVLTYGNKIVALVLAIVAVSLSTVLFPRLSRMILARAWGELDRTVRNYSLAVLIVGFPVAGILALASEPLVRLLFERGSFTPQMTQAVSQVQLWYLPQLPFAVLVMLGYRVLASLDGNRSVLAIGMLNLALSVTLNVVLMHWFGVRGIAMSTSITSAVAMLVTYAAIRWRLAVPAGTAADDFPPGELRPSGGVSKAGRYDDSSPGGSRLMVFPAELTVVRSTSHRGTNERCKQ